MLVEISPPRGPQQLSRQTPQRLDTPSTAPPSPYASPPQRPHPLTVTRPPTSPDSISDASNALSSRRAPTLCVWVREHMGDAGNERADFQAS
eukprot:2979539-Rhodomonas_salina.3